VEEKGQVMHRGGTESVSGGGGRAVSVAKEEGIRRRGEKV
jgi:hypothetical protein